MEAKSFHRDLQKLQLLHMLHRLHRGVKRRREKTFETSRSGAVNRYTFFCESSAFVSTVFADAGGQKSNTKKNLLQKIGQVESQSE